MTETRTIPIHPNIRAVLSRFLPEERIAAMERHRIQTYHTARDHGFQEVTFVVPTARWAIKDGTVVAVYAYLNMRTRRRGRRYEERITIHANSKSDYAALIDGGIVAAYARQKRFAAEMAERYARERTQREEADRFVHAVTSLAVVDSRSVTVARTPQGIQGVYLGQLFVSGTSPEAVSSKINRIVAIASET